MKKIKIILDLANNACGKLEKGLQIINEHDEVLKKYKEVFDIGFKFQYRQLSSFIHSDFKNSYEYKYIKRFSETEMSIDDFETMKKRIEELGYFTIVTPFDNDSIDIIKQQDFNYLKIASCSVTDWPLLNKIATLDKPIVISTAGASFEDIDKVVDFMNNRNKDISLMHCIAQYPTDDSNINIGQIKLLKERYKEIDVGYSTHENPDNYNSVQVALGAGALLLERHIDTECDTKNKYSSTPENIDRWLDSAKKAILMIGEMENRYKPSDSELDSLYGLRRGMFVNKDLKKGSVISKEDVFFSIPLLLNDGHYSANDFSKYAEFVLIEDLKKNDPVLKKSIDYSNNRKIVLDIINKIKDIMNKSGVAVQDEIEMELSHHYGIESYFKTGAAILNCFNNEEYCRKLLVLLPMQMHPSHFHRLKHETFIVLYGSLNLTIRKDGKSIYKVLKAGDVYAVNREVPHSFSSDDGCIFEEVSTQQFPNDSIYDDKDIMNNYNNRKTKMTFYSNWLLKELK